MNEITTISSFGKLIESKLPAIASRLPSRLRRPVRSRLRLTTEGGK